MRLWQSLELLMGLKLVGTWRMNVLVSSSYLGRALA